MSGKNGKSNEKFLNKIIKKNYNNELENLLEKKDYSEETKNILLNLLYKIEIGYIDYKQVKIEILSQEKYIKELFRILENKCNNIKLVSSNSEQIEQMENKSYIIDKKNKTILYKNLDRKLLYAIAKIDKNDKIVKEQYYILDKSISDLINVGNCINMVEPIRDFNGYSWINIPSELESIEHNIIYQNLIILVGNKFLDEWVKNSEYIIDYYDNFKIKLEDEYGKRISDYIIKILESLSIMLMIKFDKTIQEEMLDQKLQIENDLEKIQNKEEFVEKLTFEKIKIIKKIKEIDETINDRDFLEREYIKRNKKLPLEKKIFSIKVLVKVINWEREELLKKIEKINNMLNPKQFIKYKKEQDEKYKYLKFAEIQNIDEEINKYNFKLQKMFFRVLKIKLEEVTTKKQIHEYIYMLRYYMVSQLNREKRIYEEKCLNRQIDEIIRLTIKKAKELKLIENISENEIIENLIFKNILSQRTVKLEDIQLKIVCEKGQIIKNEEKKSKNYYIQILNNDILEEKVVIQNVDEILEKEIKKFLNKKINIFI